MTVKELKEFLNTCPDDMQVGYIGPFGEFYALTEEYFHRREPISEYKDYSTQPLWPKGVAVLEVEEVDFGSPAPQSMQNENILKDLSLILLTFTNGQV